MILRLMLSLPHLSVPTGPAALAWAVAVLGPLWLRVPLHPLLRTMVPGLSAVALGALGALLVQPGAPSVSGQAVAYVQAVDSWLHGLLAGVTGGVWTASVWAWRSKPVTSVARMPALIGSALAALLVAQGIGIAMGGAHGWLLVPMMTGHVAIGVLGMGMARRRLGSHTLGVTVGGAVLASWAAAAWGLEAELYRPVVSGAIDPMDVAAIQAAAASLWVTGPGLVAAVAGVSWAAREGARSASRMTGEVVGGSLALGLGLGLMGLTTHTLAPHAQGAAGGRLGGMAAEELPLARGSTGLPTGACVASGSADWTIRERFEGVTSCEGPLIVGARGEESAAKVVRHSWSETARPLEVLVRIPRRATEGGPLRYADRRVFEVGWVPGTLPSSFAPEAGTREQLDAWLTRQTAGSSLSTPEAQNVWVVDTPRGAMVLLSSLGITLEEGAEGRRALAELLAPLESPRLVQVAADGWTLQQMVDLCVDAQALVPGDVPCVWLTR